MLGKTQLPWLERVLDDAQKQAVTWKIVAISSPIDHVGPFRPIFPWDGPKTWISGYRAERTRLLKYQPHALESTRSKEMDHLATASIRF